ncbi:hypothetical protein [uncultured Croceitalea sp.]|uniref:hypothetical protein n=1 Tax=uncultured Croceitalea sp. TaxID=1798908 RepID=UPI0033056A9E
MNIAQKSLFNLIEIFRSSQKASSTVLVSETHCEQKHHHDFYCDAEKPFLNFK